jgi:hypothetical protein
MIRMRRPRIPLLGLRTTDPTGLQFRVNRVHRSGFKSRHALIERVAPSQDLSLAGACAARRASRSGWRCADADCCSSRRSEPSVRDVRTAERGHNAEPLLAMRVLARIGLPLSEWSTRPRGSQLLSAEMGGFGQTRAFCSTVPFPNLDIIGGHPRKATRLLQPAR